MKKRKHLAVGLAAMALFAQTAPTMPVTYAQTMSQAFMEEKIDILKQEMLSQGIVHTEKQITNFKSESGVKQRINIIEADLQNPNVKMMTSKALDAVVAMDSVPSQAKREMFKGHDVVAATNADMFSMTTGINMTTQIKDGNLLINNCDAEAIRKFPVFGIDATNKPFIDSVSVEGTLTAGSETIQLDMMNRNENSDNKIVAYNQLLNQKKKLTYNTNIPYLANGAMAVVRGVKNATHLKAGDIYGGTIENVYDKMEQIDIPEDAIVIAGYGSKADWIRTHLKAGNKLSFQWNIYKGENRQLANGVQEATGSHSWIVQNGTEVSTDKLIADYGQSFVTQRNARTAIGITKDHKVIAVTIDKGSAQFADSTGVSLPELATIMKEAGAVAAVNLDGGGSTEMVTRLKGTSTLVTANHPSDGNSRPVTNALLFVNLAARTGDVGEVIIDKPITMYKGASYTFSYRATDANGNPLSSAVRPVSWKASFGTIAQDGSFTAPSAAGSGTVSALVDGVEGKADVEVVDQVDSITLKDQGTVVLQPGQMKTFAFTAMKDGKQVVIDGNAATWSIDKEVGTLSKDGTLIVNSDIIAGTTATVTLKVGEIEKQIPLMLGLKDIKLDDFEHGDISQYTTNKNFVKSYDISIANDIAKSGSKSLKLDYNYGGWTTGNGAMYMIPKGDLSTNIMPKTIGMWVYGDGKAPWLRAIIKDGSNANKTINLAPRVDWIGWKYVEAPIDPSWTLPLKVSQIYAVEVDKTNQGNPNYKGAIYFDDIRFVYTNEEDMIGPTFTSIKPEKSAVYSQDVEFSAVLRDDKTGVDASSIQMMVDGAKVTPAYDAATGKVSYSLKGLTEGTHTVTVEARDFAGNVAVPALTKTIQVDLSEDTEKPVITSVTPTATAREKTATPRITFKLTDEKSGIDASSIRVAIDGKIHPVTYDEQTGWGYTFAQEALPNGSYTFTVQAKDKKGNALEPLQRTFQVEALPQPKRKDRFNITLIPDTHVSEFAKPIFMRAAQDDSDFIIHMGDMVDQSSAAEWAQVKQDIGLLGSKPFLTVPGNHESFQGNLNEYMNTFGSPTYHLTYGNTLVIGLNTSFGQSITTSDSTQFAYLEQVLAQNKQKNVLVVTHNTTKDRFGTLHELDTEDAARFETILGNYKAAHPDVDIDVVFGHLHVLDQWEKDGVTYTVTGNAAAKGYVSNAVGNMHGTGEIEVTSKGMEYHFNPFVSNVRILDEALDRTGTLKLADGAKRQLNLFGDFREVSSNYILPISQFEAVDVTWKSSNPRVASIDENGQVTAHKQGKTKITAESGGKSTTITIEVVQPSSIKPVSISVTPHKDTITQGDVVFFQTTVTDMYGTQFAVRSGEFEWSSSDPSIADVNSIGFVKTRKPGTAVISYEFQGRTGTFPLIVLPKK
ncbi:phosphodiester glycosidase family protein [Ectobacillus sp. JY-23]|uniref:phosphodiester glycosidase family protein n=1 Tax=Ectobacillus sp. JY-23 TaxID=2933872 RepID=UPI001FF4B86F|nr:phosphodiester glycosidase family protein [Ectobacillus sp. JY-23]UOY91135.1 phosphodiester glycosidase family protein [Ectobacillus sp. JY-23]